MDVRVTVHVAETGPLLFRVILRFVNPGASNVVGHVLAHHVRAGEGEALALAVDKPDLIIYDLKTHSLFMLKFLFYTLRPSWPVNN